MLKRIEKFPGSYVTQHGGSCSNPFRSVWDVANKVELVKISVPRPRFSRVLIIPPVLHTHSNTTENHFV